MTIIQSIIFTFIFYQIYYENYFLAFLSFIIPILFIQYRKVNKAKKLIPDNIHFKFGFKEYKFSQEELIEMIKEQKDFLKKHEFLKLGISDVIYKSVIEKDAEHNPDEKYAIFKLLVGEKIEPNRLYYSNINFIDTTYEVLKRNIDNNFLNVDCYLLLKELSYFDFSKNKTLLNKPRKNKLIEKDKKHILFLIEKLFNPINEDVFFEDSVEFNNRFNNFKQYLKFDVETFSDLKKIVDDKYVFEFNEFENMEQYINMEMFKDLNPDIINESRFKILFK